MLIMSSASATKSYMATTSFSSPKDGNEGGGGMLLKLYLQKKWKNNCPYLGLYRGRRRWFIKILITVIKTLSVGGLWFWLGLIDGAAGAHLASVTHPVVDTEFTGGEVTVDTGAPGTREGEVRATVKGLPPTWEYLYSCSLSGFHGRISVRPTQIPHASTSDLQPSVPPPTSLSNHSWDFRCIFLTYFPDWRFLFLLKSEEIECYY